MPAASRIAFDALRARIEVIGGVVARIRTVLPFGGPEIDRKLPKGSLALGAPHKVAGGANGAVDAPS